MNRFDMEDLELFGWSGTSKEVGEEHGVAEELVDYIDEALRRSNRTTVMAMVGTVVGSVSLAMVVVATFGL